MNEVHRSVLEDYMDLEKQFLGKISPFIMLLSILNLPGAAAQSPADLPVTRVVLFSSGVGFYEHRGQVSGDSLVRLNLNTDQMNDVLKSLLLRDEGGTLGGVTFPSQDPLERALRTFTVDLSSRPSLAGILDQVRGAEVEVRTPEKITGRILGIEIRQRAGRDGQEGEEVFLNLYSEAQVVSYSLASLGGIRFLDSRIAQDLDRALGLLLGSSDTQRKTMDIRFSGAGRRNVSLGYIVEAPVWKTSYRLDLTGGKPYLQGWAVVENTTDQDWKDVSLSLVSGRPVSFIQDLYSPLYLSRPVVQPSVQAALTPQTYQSGMGPQAPAAMPAPAPALAKSRMIPGAPEAYMEDAGEPAPMMDLRTTSVQPQATGGAAGELFQFTIRQGVSLPRRQSSLLPLVGADIRAEKISLYNALIHASHPYNGAWLTNTTGLKLPAGPVTVLDAQVYAGDALLDNLVEGDRRLITYGLDLSTLVNSSQSSSTATTAVKLLKGVLTFSRTVTWLREYQIQNKGSEARTVILEHPLGADRTLVEPPTFEEKTPEVYRFRISVPGGKTSVFQVRETSPKSDRITLTGIDSRSFISYVTNGEIPPRIRSALERAQSLKAALEDLSRQASALQQRKSSLEAEQQRIRSNLESVGRDTTQGRRFLEKLMEAETELENLGKSSEDLRKKTLEAQQAYETYLSSLDL